MLTGAPPAASGAGGSGTGPGETNALDPAVVARCFAGLETVGPMVLAVSGGPDSLALMLMAARWARPASATATFHVATVDHGLRADSRLEAEMVAAAATRLGLPHRILTWAGDKPQSRVQERARDARYALLAAYAATLEATHLLTAHHADDQAETVLMRLGRGSGIGGLAGMRRVTTFAPGLMLVRPLLDIPKSALIEACETAGLAFVDDPSNRDPAYARSRLRAEAPALARLGLDRAGLGRLARRMARAEAALEDDTSRWEKTLRKRCDPDICRLDLAPALDALPEIRIRLVRRAIAALRPDVRLRLDRLEALTDDLWTALVEGRGHCATLGGVRLILDRDRGLAIRREAVRRRGQAHRAQAATCDVP